MGPASKVTQAVIGPSAIGDLMSCLMRRGYCPVGPTLRDGSIVYDTLSRLEDLPAGWTDEQSPGGYRLQKDLSGGLFRFTVGPQSWKKFLHPAEVRLAAIERQGHEFRILPNNAPATPYAFIGVRACELAAIRLHDRVFLEDKFIDPVYQSRRGNVFIVAVNCTRCAAACFCASMGTGPCVDKGVEKGADLVLTEICANGKHLFLVETESQRGADVLAELPHEEASAEILELASEAVKPAAVQSRVVDRNGLKELLAESFYHPHWDKVADRCLACANCTMVCPTCFCSNVEDSTSLTGERAERWRRWDSCFSQMFSYIHGGSVRKSVKSRYRQWLTHKFSTWIDQFGLSGCVGCGRCIAWCPAGIDITEEVRAIQQQPMPGTAFVEDENGNA